MRLTRVTTCLTAFVVLTGATMTSADFTPVHLPPSSEADHLSVFQAFYSPGTAWYAFGARTDTAGSLVDLTNGSLVATRVDDWGFGGVLDAGSPFFGEVDDQSWTYVNGELAGTCLVKDHGEHAWNTPYDIDLTKRLRWNGKNIIAIRAVDTYLSGGVWKPIYIRAEEPTKKNIIGPGAVELK